MSDTQPKFVECPLCGQTVPSHRINDHIDAQCREPSSSSCSVFANHTPNFPRATLSRNDTNSFGPTTSGFRKASQLTDDDILSKSSSNPTANMGNENMDESGEPSLKKRRAHVPLAQRCRPETLNDFIGQDLAALRRLIERDSLNSFILWGPPGTGKTTLASIIARKTQHKFVQLSAVTANKDDIKRVIEQAKNERKLTQRQTILFLDECHRFNKAQQDSFLPFIENGTITFIGATTENPSFEVNSALLSRAQVFVLNKLSTEALQAILSKALMKENVPTSRVTTGALETIANVADGDARVALNVLELCLEATASDPQKPITAEVASDIARKNTLLYDKKGDQHFNLISALHKSMRGSDANAALYWLGRMLVGGEDPLYIARRLIRFASEDVGIADPQALVQAVAAHQACHMIGMPECNLALAQCVVYLARAPRSNELYRAYQAVERAIKDHPNADPPLHILNAPTTLMKKLGYGNGYKYYEGDENQVYLPKALVGTKFLDP